MVETRRVFGRILADLLKLVVDEDAFGLTTKPGNPLPPGPTDNEEHSFCTVMADLSSETGLIGRMQTVPLLPEDVIKVEDTPHVTIRYGLHEGPTTLTRVLEILQLVKPFRIRLRGLEMFDTPDADVLKIGVDGEELHRVNELLGTLPNTQNYSYNPHLTVAFLKKGTAQKYLNFRTGLEDMELTVDDLTYSDTMERFYDVSLSSLGSALELVTNAKKGCGAGAPGSPGFQHGNSCAADKVAALAHVGSAPVITVKPSDPGAPREGVIARGNLMKSPLPTDVSDKTNEKVRKVKNSFTNKRTVQEVPLASIVGRQSAVSKDTVKHFITSDRKEADHELPVLVKDGKKYYVFDGTHRLAADLLSGKQTAKVVVYEEETATKSKTGGTPKFKKDGSVYRTTVDGHTVEYENVTRDVGKRHWIIRVDGKPVDAAGSKEEAESWAHKAIESLKGNSLADNKRWAYTTQEEALTKFDKWVEDRLSKAFFNPTEAARWRRYIEKGFVKGANRAFDDTGFTRKKVQESRGVGFVEGQREAFLRMSLGKVTSIEKLRFLQSQTGSEVQGMTNDLRTRLRRTLADGLTRGLSPRGIAERLRKELGISATRAETIAYTELVRAHAEGQLEALEQLGVSEVGVAVEWSTAKDPCQACSPLQGVVLKVSEARGMLPRHPRCRCAWVPANIGEDKEDKRTQKRSKTKILAAIKKSEKEQPEGDWGPGQSISKTRPSSPVFNKVSSKIPCSCEVLEFSHLMQLLDKGE